MNNTLSNITHLNQNETYPWYKTPVAMFIYISIFLTCICGLPSNNNNNKESNNI